MRYDMSQGINSVNSNLCNGFNGVNNSIFGAQTALAQQMNANEIASLNRSFAEQTANTQGFTNVNAGVADLRYTVATEACADRAAISNALRDVLEANNASTQRILDQMCADKIDAKNERIADLERQLTMANLAASQSAQTAAILANNDAQTNALEQYLAPVPRPAYIVQNPNGCGCGNTCSGCGVF
jgi:hypothetical protein